MFADKWVELTAQSLSHITGNLQVDCPNCVESQREFWNLLLCFCLLEIYSHVHVHSAPHEDWLVCLVLLECWTALFSICLFTLSIILIIMICTASKNQDVNYPYTILWWNMRVKYQQDLEPFTCSAGEDVESWFQNIYTPHTGRQSRRFIISIHITAWSWVCYTALLLCGPRIVSVSLYV